MLSQALPAIAQPAPPPLPYGVDGSFLNEKSRAYQECVDDLTKRGEAKAGDTAAVAADVACARPDWSLVHMNIPGAWELIRTSKEGWTGAEPGSGIAVGQVDTGYTLHPAVKDRYSLAESVSTLKLGDSAQDTMSRGPWYLFFKAAFRDPSHGTKTASIVIGDPTAPKDPQNEGWVTGVSPAVKLIPVRGTKGPGLLVVGPNQAARAICYLAGGYVKPKGVGGDDICFETPNPSWGPTLPKLATPVKVMTIARGATASEHLMRRDGLRQALRFARDRGIIVVAASGDYEDFTVYPAESCAVISVGANVISGAPWLVQYPRFLSGIARKLHLSGSPPAREDDLGNVDDCGQFSGLKIDVSAPGAGVWRAATTEKDDHAEVRYLYGTGKGTSFSTPAVAGIAAMWLQYRAKDISKQYADRRLIPYAFSYIVRTPKGVSSPVAVCAAAKKRWHLSTDCNVIARSWESPKGSLFGRGVINAVGVLTAPLPTESEICYDLYSRHGASDAETMGCRQPPPVRLR